MFCGTFDCKIDKDRRLSIPASIGGDINGDRLVLKKGEYDCMEIHTDAEIVLGQVKPEDKPEGMYVVKCDKRRIMIPKTFFDCNSFWFGRKVTLEGKGSYIRVLPAPSSMKRN